MGSDKNTFLQNLKLEFRLLSKKSVWMVLITIFLVITKIVLIAVSVKVNLPKVANCNKVSGFNTVSENAYNLYTCGNDTKVDNAIFGVISFDDYRNVFILWIFVDVFLIVSSIWLLGVFFVHDEGALFAAEFVFPYVSIATIAFLIELGLFGVIFSRYSHRPSPIRNEYFGQLFYREDRRSIVNLRKKHSTDLINLTPCKLCSLFIRMLVNSIDFCWALIVVEKYKNEPPNVKLMICHEEYEEDHSE